MAELASQFYAHEDALPSSPWVRWRLLDLATPSRRPPAPPERSRSGIRRTVRPLRAADRGPGRGRRRRFRLLGWLPGATVRGRARGGRCSRGLDAGAPAGYATPAPEEIADGAGTPWQTPDVAGLRAPAAGAAARAANLRSSPADRAEVLAEVCRRRRSRSPGRAAALRALVEEGGFPVRRLPRGSTPCWRRGRALPGSPSPAAAGTLGSTPPLRRPGLVLPHILGGAPPAPNVPS